MTDSFFPRIYHNTNGLKCLNGFCKQKFRKANYGTSKLTFDHLINSPPEIYEFLRHCCFLCMRIGEELNRLSLSMRINYIRLYWDINDEWKINMESDQLSFYNIISINRNAYIKTVGISVWYEGIPKNTQSVDITIAIERDTLLNYIHCQEYLLIEWSPVDSHLSSKNRQTTSIAWVYE